MVSFLAVKALAVVVLLLGRGWGQITRHGLVLSTFGSRVLGRLFGRGSRTAKPGAGRSGAELKRSPLVGRLIATRLSFWQARLCSE